MEAERAEVAMAEVGKGVVRVVVTGEEKAEVARVEERAGARAAAARRAGMAEARAATVMGGRGE